MFMVLENGEVMPIFCYCFTDVTVIPKAEQGV